MSDLHPDAKALIDAAKRGELPMSTGARARVHRSVVGRAAAFAAGVGTTTASVAAKGGVLAGVLASPLVTAGVVAAIGGVGLFVAQSAWKASVHPLVVAPPVAFHVVMRGADTKTDSQSAPATTATTTTTTTTIATATATATATTTTTTTTTATATATTMMAPPPSPSSVSFVRPPDRAPASPVESSPAVVAQDVVLHDPQPVGEGAVAPPQSQLPMDAPEAQVSRRPGDVTTSLAALHRAYAALRAGQPDQALEVLRGSADVLASGPFAEEALAARASALCQSGRTREGQAAIDRFLFEWPRSPLASRLRVGCAALGGIGRPPPK